MKLVPIKPEFFTAYIDMVIIALLKSVTNYMFCISCFNWMLVNLSLFVYFLDVLVQLVCQEHRRFQIDHQYHHDQICYNIHNIVDHINSSPIGCQL